MGVNIRKFIHDKAEEAITTINVTDAKWKEGKEIWAIDASIYIYKFCYDFTNKGKCSHISGFFTLFKILLSNGITPIVIFDGKQPEIKKHEIERRKQDKKDKLAKLDEYRKDAVVNKKAIEQIEKSLIVFSENVYTDIIELCDILNLVHIRAEYEADILALSLYHNGKVTGIVSEDNDILMGQCSHVYSKYNYSEIFECINIDKVLEILSLKLTEFIDMCIIIGTDYTMKSPVGIGAITGYKLIQKYGTIENIITNTDKIKFDSDEFDFISARKYILSSQNKIDDYPDFPKWKCNIDFLKLKSFLKDKCNMKNETVEKFRLMLN